MNAMSQLNAIYRRVEDVAEAPRGGGWRQ